MGILEHITQVAVSFHAFMLLNEIAQAIYLLFYCSFYFSSTSVFFPDENNFDVQIILVGETFSFSYAALIS